MSSRTLQAVTSNLSNWEYRELSRLYVHSCVCSETLLTRYLAEYLTRFHQTYINDALSDSDERVTIWGQMVKVTVE